MEMCKKADADKDKPKGIHPSHKNVRMSDASRFDFICDDCGETDDPLRLTDLGPNGGLTKPCTGPRK